MRVGRVNSKYVFDSYRLNSDFHLTDGVVYDRFFRSMNHETLGALSSDIFCAGRSKRIYVDKENGIPYLGNTDITSSNPLSSCNYASKKFWKEGKGFLKEGMILTGRVGQNTVGAFSFASKEVEGSIGSDNVIRIISNGKVENGYLYSFLASKYGFHLARRHISGNAQPFITEEMLADLPIPILPQTKQQEIHSLIIEASNLRAESNKLLREAIEMMEEKLPSIEFKTIYKAKISSRTNHNSRIEATYNTNSIEGFYRVLNENNIELKSISELSDQVFTPGIFKRIRTNNPDKGVPFLSGSDLLNQYPNFQSFLSRKMKNIDNYILRDGWIAIQDAGTIGYLSYITKFLDGVSATNNLVRVVPNENDNKNYYIYCFLKTKVGQNLLKSLEYGSVQKHIDNHQISSFLVPIFHDIEGAISEKVEKCMINLSDACFMEKEAIELVEKEIESWQES
ncbi:restriction endonuclease subunit S [Cyclobacterium sp. SYSU L10401]|uniref:restriction endonuclease subunit S n=1 Tax=Cyclobacterium sp. SYSU L10401 TaxID=2678657 RepID=UPI0013D10F45|nr:restriction endonuclease subunit S [Cyclobacterium sp. SYSU L10401]